MKLYVQGLKKDFDEKQVLKGASFCFEQGHIYGLIGRNGAGKTTFFICLNDDVKPDEGSFEVEENGQVRPLTAEDIGYVLSNPSCTGIFDGARIFKVFSGCQPQTGAAAAVN